MITVKTHRNSRVCQGDIVRDVEYIEYVTEKAGVIEVSKVVFPLAAVLTQDCDLEQDYRYRWSPRYRQKANQDKWLLSVILAPLYNAEHVYAGEHLSQLGITMEPINKKKSPGDYLRKNERPRYHYLEFPAKIPIVPSVIDFKHYFAVNVSYLKKLKRTNFVCSLSDICRADVSHRFASYLARVGLPDIPAGPTSSTTPSASGLNTHGHIGSLVS